METKHIKDILPTVQANAQQPSTTARQVNIAAWEKYLAFDTCGDEQLVRMLKAAVNFLLDVRERKPYPWLVLLGTSGAGKSHLCQKIYTWWFNSGRWYTAGKHTTNLVRSGDFVLWSVFINNCRSGNFSGVEGMCEADFLVMDDIGAGADNRAWIADKLYHIIEHRVASKNPFAATIITANLSLEQLADAYDQRIASRLIRRGRDKVIEVNVPDFKMR